MTVFFFIIDSNLDVSKDSLVINNVFFKVYIKIYTFYWFNTTFNFFFLCNTNVNLPIFSLSTIKIRCTLYIFWEQSYLHAGRQKMNYIVVRFISICIRLAIALNMTIWIRDNVLHVFNIETFNKISDDYDQEQLIDDKFCT